MLAEIRPGVLAFCDFDKNLARFRGMKWCFSDSKSVPERMIIMCLHSTHVGGYPRDDANGPNIDLLVVTFTALLENLWRNVTWSPTQCCAAHCSIMWPNHHSSESKISNLNIHLMVQEQISGLQVAMNDVAHVKVLNSTASLDHVSTDFGHCEI